MAPKPTSKSTKETASEDIAADSTEETADDVLEIETGETEEANAEGPDNSNLVRKKEIYDHVVIATGLRKREVRESVDSLLAYLHECLSEGKEIVVPPLGKIRVIEKTNKEGESNTKYRVVLKKPNLDENSEEESKEALAEKAE